MPILHNYIWVQDVWLCQVCLPFSLLLPHQNLRRECLSFLKLCLRLWLVMAQHVAHSPSKGLGLCCSPEREYFSILYCSSNLKWHLPLANSFCARTDRIEWSRVGWMTLQVWEEAPQTGEVTTNQSRCIRVESPCDTDHQGSRIQSRAAESLDVDKQTAHKYPWAKIIYGRGESVLNCRDNSCETPAPLRAYLMKSWATQVGVRSECGQVWPVWTMWE